MEGVKNIMKKWIIDGSIDGNMLDFSEIVESEKEPDFWECYEIAQNHNCDFFTVTELEEE